MRTRTLAQTDAGIHGARLVINLDAIAANYRKISALAAPARTAAVIKANAYGLGLAPVARCLANAGCDIFFVAHYAEGVALRQVLPDVRIYILHGLPDDAAQRYIKHGLRPVINSLRELAVWRGESGRQSGAILNFDTGMSRLGLGAQDVALLKNDPGLLSGVKLDYIMSHLACADEPSHPLNARQLGAFNDLRRLFPGVPASLANTAGTLLGAKYCYDLVRPGIGLYGGSPSGSGVSPFQNAVCLYAKILQIRDVDRGDYVGYGASYRPEGPARIAVAGIGYADGFMRVLSNLGVGAIGGRLVPLVGRISMDLCTFDVSGAPTDLCVPGSEIELIGPHVPVERVGALAGIINYEILAHLGGRFARTDVGEGSGS
ncbi:MAG: alanine racemase [Alphaproteobacteria bacterium]